MGMVGSSESDNGLPELASALRKSGASASGIVGKASPVLSTCHPHSHLMVCGVCAGPMSSPLLDPSTATLG